MSRVLKLVKDKEGNEIEVYVTSCNSCNKEMIFPKKIADSFEEMIPFLKAKIDAGTPCAECTKKQEAEGVSSLFTDEEKEQIKEAFTKVLTQQLKEQEEQEE